MRFALSVSLLLLIALVVDCQTNCFGIPSNTTGVCNGAGTCIDENLCSCEANVGSPTCASPYFPTRGQIIAGKLDGTPSSSLGLFGDHGLSYPTSVVASGAGVLFVADKGNNRIVSIDTSGNMSLVLTNDTCPPEHLSLVESEERLYYICGTELKYVDLNTGEDVSVELDDFGIPTSFNSLMLTAVNHSSCEGIEHGTWINGTSTVYCVSNFQNPVDIMFDDGWVVLLGQGLNAILAHQVERNVKISSPFVDAETPVKITKHQYTRQYFISTASGKIYQTSDFMSMNFELISSFSGNTVEGFGNEISVAATGLFFDTIRSRLLIASSATNQIYSITFECERGFGGNGCNEPICFGYLSSHSGVCNGQGRCVAPNHCICNSENLDNSTACAGKQKVMIEVTSSFSVAMSDKFGKLMVRHQDQGFVVCDNLNRLVTVTLNGTVGSPFTLFQPCLSMVMDESTHTIYLLTTKEVIVVSASFETHSISVSPLVGNSGATESEPFSDGFGTSSRIKHPLSIQLYQNYIYLLAEDRICEINLVNKRLRTIIMTSGNTNFVVDDFGDLILSNGVEMTKFSMQTGLNTTYEHSRPSTVLYKRPNQNIFLFDQDTGTIGTISDVQGYKELAGTNNTIENNDNPFNVRSMYYDNVDSQLIFFDGPANRGDLKVLQERCPVGYGGLNCDKFVCYGELANSSEVCSGNGTCVGPNTCQCDNGTIGADCSSTDFQILTVEGINALSNISSFDLDSSGGIYYVRSLKLYLLKDGITTFIGNVSAGLVDIKLVEEKQLVYGALPNRLGVMNLETYQTSAVSGPNTLSSLKSGFGEDARIPNPKVFSAGYMNTNILYISCGTAIVQYDIITGYMNIVMGGEVGGNHVDTLFATQFTDIQDMLIDSEATLLVADSFNVKAVNLYSFPRKFDVFYANSVSAMVDLISIQVIVKTGSHTSTSKHTLQIPYDSLSGNGQLNHPTKARYDKVRNKIIVLDGGIVYAIGASIIPETSDIALHTVEVSAASSFESTVSDFSNSQFNTASTDQGESFPTSTAISSSQDLAQSSDVYLSQFPPTISTQSQGSTSSDEPSRENTSVSAAIFSSTLTTDSELSESSGLPVESTLENLSESSNLQETSEIATLSVIIERSLTFDPCTSLNVKATVDRPISNSQYTWRLVKQTETGIVPAETTTTRDDVSFDLKERQTGWYTLEVFVSGYWKGSSVSASSTFEFLKPENQFGENCVYKIDFTSSARLPSDGDVVVFNRVGKLYLKTQIDAPGITILWTIPNRRDVRSSLNYTALVTTDSSSSDFGLDGSRLANGLPGDVELSVVLTIKIYDQIMFVRSFQYKTSPSLPIQIPPDDGLNIISSYSEIQLTKKGLPVNGIALQTVFAIIATNWTRRSIDEEFTYIFSYSNTKSGKYVPIATTRDGVVNTVLPLGGSDSKLKIQLKVLNNWDDFVTTTKELVIIAGSPKDQALLIEELLNDLIAMNETKFISGAISLAAYIEQESLKIGNKALKPLFSYAIDTLLNHTAQLFASGDQTQLNDTSTQQRIAVVEVLTRTTGILSPEAKHIALNLMNNVLSTHNTTGSMTSGTTMTLIADVVSNIVAAKFEDERVANAILHTTNTIVSTLLNQQLISEAPTNIVSDNVQISVQVAQSSKISNSNVQTESPTSALSSTVSIPATFASDIEVAGSEIISYTAVTFSENPFQYLNTEQEPSVPVLDIKFRYYNRTIIPVANLTQPLLLEISKAKRCDLVGDYATFSCKYWDEISQEWKGDGCEWVNDDASSNKVRCQCTHTTSFSAFILRKGKCPERSIGLSTTGIIFNTLYIILSSVVLIGLIFTRNEQPAQSRFIAPYVGMLAIIVDGILQGWISNSLAIGLKLSKFDALDTFSYIIMLVSNPLSIAGLYVFLWQQIRFLMLQNIYFLMGETGSLQKGVMKLGRIIASKLVFAVSTIAVGVAVLLYFGVLVAVAATREGARATDRIIAIQATSYAAMLIALALGISLALIVDVAIAFRRNRIEDNEEGKDGQVHRSEEMKGLGLLAKHITDYDPLMFRIEAVLILIALVLLLVLYPIGIAGVFKDSPARSALSIVRFLFEILFMLMKISAFGGFVCTVTVLQKWKASRAGQSSLLVDDRSCSDDTNSSDTQFIEFLRDKEGSRMLESYARREFSLENLLLFRELEMLRSNNLIMSTSERRAVLENMDVLYMRNNAERQLNCANSVRLSFNATLAIPEPTLVDTEAIFLKLYNVCVMNLADTFSRFSSTSQYKQFMAAKELQEHLQQTVI